MTVYLNSYSSISSLSTPTTPLLKKEIIALPFGQQLDDIDRKINEFRQSNTRNKFNSQLPISQQAQQFRLQQPLPQQQSLSISQQLRSNSLSPQYLIPQQQQQQQQQTRKISSPLIISNSHIQQQQQQVNLSTTSSISSLSTVTSDFLNNNLKNSKFDEILSKNFNPFGTQQQQNQQNSNNDNGNNIWGKDMSVWG